MEFKRIPFIAVQRKFNLTDRQMYYIRDRIRKYHKEDEWFIFEYNAIGEKELWIYLEGVHWIEEVLTDALELLPIFDSISDDEHNRFTKRDVVDAMNMYQESYVTYSRAEVERVSGISVPPNKRNGRKQEIHIKYMNNQRAFKVEMGECTNGGRPNKAKIVEEWRTAHPEGTPKDCIADTGISKNTVYKWWSVGEAL